jgi:hypothetical protein
LRLAFKPSSGCAGAKGDCLATAFCTRAYVPPTGRCFCLPIRACVFYRPIFLYSLDRSARNASICKMPIVSVRLLYNPRAVILRVRPPSGWSHLVGQYIKIRIGAVSSWEWHPFSIASSPRSPGAHPPSPHTHTRSVSTCLHALPPFVRSSHSQTWSSFFVSLNPRCPLPPRPSPQGQQRSWWVLTAQPRRPPARPATAAHGLRASSTTSTACGCACTTRMRAQTLRRHTSTSRGHMGA